MNRFYYWLPLKLTAQGWVGTSENHDFLFGNHYGMDAVGGEAPFFLLVPEADHR